MIKASTTLVGFMEGVDDSGNPFLIESRSVAAIQIAKNGLTRISLKDATRCYLSDSFDAAVQSLTEAKQMASAIKGGSSEALPA